MHEKEDELFLQLEKAIRLEEDCEKVSDYLTKFHMFVYFFPPVMRFFKWGVPGFAVVNYGRRTIT
jgi:hypothetical protein